MSEPIPEVEVCSRCGNEIDPTQCHCGTSKETHGNPMETGHEFVPMGCTCGYAKELDEHPPLNISFPKAKI